MKYNLTEPILDYTGVSVKDPVKGKPEEDWEDLTWTKVIYRALNLRLKEEDPMTSEKKERAFKITTRAYGKMPMEMSSDDVAFLTERIDKIFNNVLIVGQAKEFFGQQKKPTEQPVK